MLVPVSWLKDYVDIDIPAELLAEKLTLAGLEVAKMHYFGVPQTPVEGLRLPPSDHLVWDRSKIVLGAIREVKPHPNADRLVIAMVDHGGGELEQTVTGAPNLFEYKGLGELPTPLWTGFAREGAEVWDGHSEVRKRMILKEKPLRGIPNRCMVCSEYELGLSEEHEGIILMHDDPGYPPGTPLQDVWGDIVLEIEFTPNLARAISVYGVAREAAALLGKPLREPSYDVVMEGAGIEGQAFIDIRVPELNPRFTLALLRDCVIKPSPEWMQRRLRLAGQRPINNIVDVTNYVNFELGQPLHAFDYDKLVERADGKAPTIITRLPNPGETLETLDEVKRTLDAHNILVTDTGGALSIGGIIGGAETEISESTKNVLLEAASWNFINIRRTMSSQKVHTDAGYRFSRGVHPSRAILGVKRGIELMRQTGGGKVANGIIDEYPLPPQTVVVELYASEVERLLGLSFSVEQIADMLTRAGFAVIPHAESLTVTAPDSRMDISSDPIIGQADLIEEIGRIYGYDNLPTTMIADAMPPQRPNLSLELEEAARDLLVSLGLRENISYRLTTPEREAALVPPGAASSLPPVPYIALANPITTDKAVLRHTLLINLLENARSNARYQTRQAVFEIGAIYLPVEGELLPDEPRRLGILMTGARTHSGWQHGTQTPPTMDFYDLKGVVEGMLHGLHVPGVSYVPGAHTTFHPGRAAQVLVNGTSVGTFGELHPLVAERFEFSGVPVLAAEFDLEALSAAADTTFPVKPLPQTPPVLQDIALVVNDTVTAAQVEVTIRKAGGSLLKEVRLFDVYTGEPIPAGHKSLAFALTYQDDERTLSDKDVAPVHAKIVKVCERDLGAKLRA